MTSVRKQQTPRSYHKIVYCVNQFAFIRYFFHGCSYYCFSAIIFAPKIWKYINLNGDVTRWRISMSCDCTSKYYAHCIHWNEHRMPHHPKVEGNFPFVVCRPYGQQNGSCAVRHVGDKRYWNGHTFLRIQFALEMELISLFYKMYYYIRPGLGLQCAIVVFPNHTRLCFCGL